MWLFLFILYCDTTEGVRHVTENVQKHKNQRVRHVTENIQKNKNNFSFLKCNSLRCKYCTQE